MWQHVVLCRTGMALAHCILGKFLGVVCHCFSPPLDVPTFTARFLYVPNDARDPIRERWNCEREICPVILPKFRIPLKFRDLLHAANLRHGTDGFTSPPKEGVLRIFSPCLVYKYWNVEQPCFFRIRVIRRKKVLKLHGVLPDCQVHS